MTLVDGRCSPVQAVHSTAMTGTQDPDLREQHRGPTQEEGDEEEEGEKVHVSVQGEEKEQDREEEEEEEEEEKEELPYPTLAPVVLLALTQTSPPRSWCLRAVCHPYPLPPGVHLKHWKPLYFLKAVVPTRHLAPRCLPYV
ncbi:hypothetical protein PFLUV_G00012340 [Perca fluviatilis]|uniref:Uncharacterized protein n=1 Tax=Perca fluviatilis TaxID=8168 RepID=A0A6A5FS71_PERFL|nr:hypothetical protein PFLUV_G00012340 [Perca fluviatilis]